MHYHSEGDRIPNQGFLANDPECFASLNMQLIGDTDQDTATLLRSHRSTHRSKQTYVFNIRDIFYRTGVSHFLVSMNGVSPSTTSEMPCSEVYSLFREGLPNMMAANNASLLPSRVSATSCTPFHGVFISLHCSLNPVARKSMGTAAECVRLSTWENSFSVSKTIPRIIMWRMSYGSWGTLT
jgi:hypothetical protein